MSQPPYYNFYQQQRPYHQQHPYHQQQPFPKQHLIMQQHQIIPHQPPYLMQQQPMQQINPPPNQPHWFDQMCEVITTQQSCHEAGSLDTTPYANTGKLCSMGKLIPKVY